MKIFYLHNFKFFLFSFSFFFTSAISFSQNFSGTVTSYDEEVITDCYILFLNSDTNEILEYIIPNEKGFYSIDLNLKNTSNIKISCQGISYIKQSKVFLINKETESYINNFKLAEKKYKLDEVIVTAKRVKIQIKNDTIVYDVSQFQKTEDRKIIDVLKKMPGIQVDEGTGLIQYKGKPIETLLLDGDDLFGKGYSVGARNISSEIVDKVEAIEDYHDNRLKKGLKQSEKVVLNLKFKKNKFKISGEASLGLGNHSYLSNINSINLSKRVKGFGVYNMNNISINQTSFQKETYQSENREEIENYGIDFFKGSNVAQTTNFPRSYINNLKFGTYTNLFKISKKTNLKNSISFFNDKNNFSYNSSNELSIDSNNLLITNETYNKSLPKHLTFTNSLSHDIDESSIIKYDNRYLNKTNNFSQINIQNNVDLFNTIINNKKFFYQQNINYTKKISAKELIEINIFNSNDSNYQNLKIENQNNNISLENNFEETNSKRNTLSSSISYFKKINDFDFQIQLKSNYDNEDFAMFTNNQIYNYDTKNITYSTNLKFNYFKKTRFKITSDIEIGHSSRSLENEFENNKLSKNNLFLNTDTKVRYKLSKNSSLSLNIKNINRPISNSFLFSNPLLIDSRTIQNNRPSLYLEKNWSTSLNFTNYNILKQSNFTFLVSYEETRNTFLAEQTINEDVSFITYFQTPLTLKDISLSISKGFFVDIINNKININSNANFNEYYNSVNQDLISQVYSSIYNFNIELNSAFESFFNYKSSFGITYLTNKQENNDSFINSNINAKLESIFKVSQKTYFKFEKELLLPRGDKISKNQLFLDFSFNHISKKIEYFILAQNLLNKSSFNQMYTTEFSKSTFSNELFSRYLIVGLNYKF